MKMKDAWFNLKAIGVTWNEGNVSKERTNQMIFANCWLFSEIKGITIYLQIDDSNSSINAICVNYIWVVLNQILPVSSFTFFLQY